MTPTLALERLMLHPDYAQFVDELRAALPVAVVDQADAATADALHLMTGAARLAKAESAGPAAAADVPGWVRLALLDTLTAWADGKGTTCRHQPTPGRPQPVLAAAWKPGLVVCAHCVHLTSLPPGGARDRTCDRCGRVCAGTEHRDGIYPGMVQLGPLIYQYGTCADCRPPINPNDSPTSATHTGQHDTAKETGRGRPRGQRRRRRGKGTTT